MHSCPLAGLTPIVIEGGKFENIQIYDIIGSGVMGLFRSKQEAKDTSPLKSEALDAIAAEFCLEKQELHKIYACFTSFQSVPKSFLTLDDIAEAIHDGSPNFAELPYLQRLFLLISRKTPGKLFFEDYLTGISTFCLMNSEAVLRFVFDWIDRDSDERVTVEDIVTAAEYKNPKTGQPTFFCNFIGDLERVGRGRTTRFLKFEQFRQQSNLLLFLLWPAYELQGKLREANLGGSFWKQQYAKIQKAEMLLKNSEKKAFRMLDKVRLLSTIRPNRDIPISIHQQERSRTRGCTASDMQLLQMQPPKRRNSCPYIKPEMDARQNIQEQTLV